ncbi:MAG TPA: rhodanese-like domain-containing protein [Myxococcota bacterium]|nr:rhodanese-like domain-containing protein [Myxococcota bacterium]HRY91994.1 rhodanese-like domain-containing protein [Myxococcota bacterium]HSA23276.1 rhodanese-like domain-containing protein [Myxococcota bacterium]
MLTWKRAGALLALLLGAALWLFGSPSPEERLAAQAAALEARLAAGEAQLEPFELLELGHNPGLRLELLDLREENEFNLFHILDARRTTLPELATPAFASGLPRDAVVVLVSNGEGRAREGWKLLSAQRVPRVYLLAGGIHGWLQAFGFQARLGLTRGDCPLDDCRRYTFEAALGDRHPESDPGVQSLAGREFTRKVKLQASARRKAGSCG